MLQVSWSDIDPITASYLTTQTGMAEASDADEHLYALTDGVSLQNTSSEANSTQNQIFDLNDIQHQVLAWLRRLCHKRAQLDVLIVGSVIPTITLSVLREFAPLAATKYCFRTCIVAGHAMSQLDTFKGLLENEPYQIRLSLLDLSMSPLEQGFEPQSFDLILTGTWPQRGVALQSEIGCFKFLLRDGGRIVISGYDRHPVLVDNNPWPNGGLSACTSRSIEYGDREAENDWRRILQESGLHLESFIRNESGFRTTLAIASTGTQMNTPDFAVQELIILTPTHPSLACGKLEVELRKRFACRTVTAKVVSLAETETVAGKVVISLLEAEQPLFVAMSAAMLEKIQRLFSAARYVLWITRGGQMIHSEHIEFSPTIGLLRTLRLEMAQTLIPHLDLSPSTSLASPEAADAIVACFEATSVQDAASADMEYAEHRGRLYIPRLVTDDSFDEELEAKGTRERILIGHLGREKRKLKLSTGSSGTFTDLRWVDDELAVLPLSACDVEIQAHVVGLDVEDLKIVRGQHSATTPGHIVSGVVTKVGSDVVRFQPGDQVVMIRAEACRAFPRQAEDLIQSIPSGINMAEATATFRAYIVAYHALFNLARLRDGETILITDAAASLGQAAIQLARFIGADIFVTVESDRDKSLLQKRYGVADDHIRPRSNRNFAPALRRTRTGVSVDVVFHTLDDDDDDDSYLANTRVSQFGRIVRIGKQHRPSFVQPNVTVCYLDMESVVRGKSSMLGQLLEKVTDLFTEGHIAPIRPVQIRPVSQISEVLTEVQEDPRRAVAVLDIRADAPVRILAQRPAPLQLIAEASYILGGGLGGIGSVIAERMVDQGARHLIFLSRSGARTAKAKAILERLERRGCTVSVFACDIANRSELQSVLDTCSRHHWDIRGVLQCAAVLRVSTTDV